ncbi:MAG: hypothetical protein M3Q45_09565, partial [Chloroflexota bacterium]|nr:hypothetical protein [Chloroflexota bacterium]
LSVSGFQQMQAIEADGFFYVDQKIKLAMHSWLPGRSWPGATLNVNLSWREPGDWPSSLAVFVHLRRESTLLAQADGVPHFFYLYDFSNGGMPQETLDEWRQLTVPIDAQPGETLTVVIGLYNPQTGQRADVLDANGNVIGNEVVIGQVQVGLPPVPDQACALIAATCAAQPVQ